jgi:hypothetical protein
MYKIEDCEANEGEAKSSWSCHCCHAGAAQLVVYICTVEGQQ